MLTLCQQMTDMRNKLIQLILLQQRFETIAPKP